MSASRRRVAHRGRDIGDGEHVAGGLVGQQPSAIPQSVMTVLPQVTLQLLALPVLKSAVQLLSSSQPTAARVASTASDGGGRSVSKFSSRSTSGSCPVSSRDNL